MSSAQDLCAGKCPHHAPPSPLRPSLFPSPEEQVCLRTLCLEARLGTEQRQDKSRPRSILRGVLWTSSFLKLYPFGPAAVFDKHSSNTTKTTSNRN